MNKSTRLEADMKKKGHKTPRTAPKGTRLNKAAAAAGGLRISGSKPPFPTR